jgi:hypothetical protein
MPQRLAGQLIGSIRKVWFIADPAIARCGVPLADGSPPAPGGLIEIETKAGRYAHLAAASGSSGIGLYAGAAWPPADACIRQWQDLTESVPTAFDGRPTITAVVPVDPESNQYVAREWRIDLSTGVTLRCRRSLTGLDFREAGT